MQHISAALPGSAERKPKGLTDDEILAHLTTIADLYNKGSGNLDSKDGYNCIKCGNRGDYMIVYQNKTFGYWTSTLIPCSCVQKRNNYSRGKGSGIPEECTLDKFRTDNAWQEQMLHDARHYIDNGARNGRWCYIGGTVGSGKTHLASGIARELLYDMNVVFMNWVRDARELKACVNDYEYPVRINRFINADLLVVDDLWKHAHTPTDADLRLAYDILNERYTQKKPTIITSEWSAAEIYRIDQAIGSRIAQMADGFIINNEGAQDMRMRYLRT